MMYALAAVVGIGLGVVGTALYIMVGFAKAFGR
jgi:hypothetical protein